MKTKTIVFLLILLVIPTVLAVTPTYRQGEPVNIIHPLRLDGAPDPNILGNITIRDPNNNVIVSGGIMSYNPTSQDHNYTLQASQTSKIGVYPYCITATNLTLSKTECFDLEITLTGDKADTAESVGFFIIGAGSILFFLLALFGAIKIPFKNRKNAMGLIVGLNELKYVKLLLWFVCYLLLIFITFAFAQFSRTANIPAAYSFLNASFWFLIGFLFPAFVILFISGIINFFADKKIKQMLDRGLRVK